MINGTALLDVNVLVAFLWTEHIHHERARSWLSSASERVWATCPLSELGCIRVLAGQTLTQNRFTVQSAEALLRAFISRERHEFWPDHLQTITGEFSASLRHIQGPKQLTDRYLLALAASHDGTFATFDRSVGAGLPSDSPLLSHLEVIDV